MTDLTDQWIVEATPDPINNPLLPTIRDIEDYADDLEYEGNHITIEWATRELTNYQTGWIRVGLLAHRVRLYRLYRDKFPTWNDYCKEVLGKKDWQIRDKINAAMAVMELIEAGFDVVPTCQSQAESLLNCCKKRGGLLIDLWHEVLDQLPKRWMLTANRIGECLGFAIENNNIRKKQRDRLAELARRDGVTLSEKVDELIAADEDSAPCDDELDEVDPELPEEEQLWHKQMLEDVERHDNQIWLLGAFAKLLPKVSRFDWLRQVRCQV